MTMTNTWNYREDLSQDVTRDVVGYDVVATDGDIGCVGEADEKPVMEDGLDAELQ